MGMISPETSKKLADVQAIAVGIKELADAPPDEKGGKPLKISVSGKSFAMPKGDISDRYLGLLVQESQKQLVEINEQARRELGGDPAHTADHDKKGKWGN